MRRLVISATIGFALFVVATTALRPHSVSSIGAGAMPPVRDLQGDTSKLPAEVLEDRSLVYPNIPQR